MKSKKLMYLLSTLLAIPISYAEESCGITNLASCLPMKFFEFILTLINAPFQPFLTLTKNLLADPVNIDAYISLWAIIIYLISLFYGLFFFFAGFNFIISGYSAEKRAMAKEWLKNVVLMIIFVQASFYIYSLIIEVSSMLTTSIINMIDPNFFLLTMDNFANLSMELTLSLPYLAALLLCIIFLTIRYILVAIGVISFPIAIFLNFIPPLKSYGALLLNTLLILIFLPFAQALILLGSSMLIEIPLFANFKMLITIGSFTLVTLSMVFLLAFAIIKAALSVLKSPIGQAAKYIIMS